jgi:hypothetical protein
MPAAMKPRSALALLAAAATAALAPGCGGDSSGSAVAELAPPGVPVLIEGTLRPQGELRENAEAIAMQVAGVDNLGEFVVEKLEERAREDGEPFDFATEVEPWLGEHAGVFFERYDGEEFSGVGAIVEATDADAAGEFVAKHEGGGENVAATIGDFVAVAEDDKVLGEMVSASEGDSLADEDTFAETIAAAGEGSLADVYVDLGDLVEKSGGIDPNVRQLLGSTGVDPSEATLVASIVPGADQVTIELSSDLGGREAPTGDASKQLGEMPGNAFAALAASGFGGPLQEAIDSLDAAGIPEKVPPNQLKKGLKQLGIDLEAVAGSVQDAAVFAVGGNERSLGGALVATTKGSGATEAVANIGKLLRQVNVDGVTALSGRYSGFSIRSADLGNKPLVITAKQGRLAVGYGLAPTLNGLLSEAGKGKTLSQNPAYDDAVAALGDTPVSGFADGSAALRLADALIPSSDENFEGAKKYLKSIRFLALGSASQDDFATAKLIVGLK